MNIVLHFTALQLMVIAAVREAQGNWYCLPLANSSACTNSSSYVSCDASAYNYFSSCKGYSCNSQSSGCSCTVGSYNCNGNCTYELSPDVCNCDADSHSCYCLKDLKPGNDNMQNKSVDNIINIIDQIANISGQMSPEMAVDYLKIVDSVQKVISVKDKAQSVSYGNTYINAYESLVSALVTPTDNYTLKALKLDNTDVSILVVGPNATVEQIPSIRTEMANMEIDLYGIANRSPSKSASATFMSFREVSQLLKADFFNTSNDTIKTMMSTVISANLPNSTNIGLTKPVNFTFRHITKLDPRGSVSCVYWNISEWIVDGCSVLETNSSSTVCSCVHLSTFALIMQTSRSPENDPLLDLLGLVCVIVGLVFFSLALLTFVLCQWGPGVNNVARINICISMLSAHLLFLLTQQFLSLIRPRQVLCAVMSGLLHFLFLSGFVWMFIEAVLLFICVKNLSQISSKKREVLSSGFLCVVGYVVALVVVSVSVGLVPEGYGSEQCWIKMENGFIWSFLGPVCVILGLNMMLFMRIVITLNSTLKTLNPEVAQMKQTKILTFKTLAQFVVLGCPWFLGFFTNNSKVLEILFLILNSQQGTFIFLIYCVFNKEIMGQYRKFFRSLYSGPKQ